MIDISFLETNIIKKTSLCQHTIYTLDDKYTMKIFLVSDSGTKDASLSLGGRIMIPTFLKLMSDHKREPENETDICAAFKEFDLDGSGLISLKELKKMMTGMGEKLSDEEFDSMLKEAKISSNGEVKYEEFVKSLFSK